MLMLEYYLRNVTQVFRLTLFVPCPFLYGKVCFDPIDFFETKTAPDEKLYFNRVGMRGK